jgi:hypothetical protein
VQAHAVEAVVQSGGLHLGLVALFAGCVQQHMQQQCEKSELGAREKGMCEVQFERLAGAWQTQTRSTDVTGKDTLTAPAEQAPGSKTTHRNSPE